MKANEFIKNYGLEESRKYLKEFHELDHVYMGDGFYIGDLRDLLSSFDFINSMGGLYSVKELF